MLRDTQNEIPSLHSLFAVVTEYIICAQGSQPLYFEVIQAEKLTENFRGDNAAFNQTAGELSLPFVDITDANNDISTYAAELQLIPDLPMLTFELKQIVLVK